MRGGKLVVVVVVVVTTVVCVAGAKENCPNILSALDSCTKWLAPSGTLGCILDSWDFSPGVTSGEMALDFGVERVLKGACMAFSTRDGGKERFA